MVLVCPSIGDENYLLNYLKESINKNHTYILSPHPAYQDLIIKKYLLELENSVKKTFKHLSTFDLFKISDIVLCGFSTVAYEALFLGAQPVRVIDPYQPQFFDLKDGLLL